MDKLRVWSGLFQGSDELMRAYAGLVGERREGKGREENDWIGRRGTGGKKGRPSLALCKLKLGPNSKFWTRRVAA